MESIHLNQLKYYVQGFAKGHSEQMFSRNELPSAQMICSEYMNLNILLVRTALDLLRSKEHVLQTGCDRTAVRSFGETWGICTRRAGKLYRARSRLYRRRFLQGNMRWKALAEIYAMHSFASFSMLKIFVKNR